MNEDNVILDFDKALNLLDSISDTFKIDIWIPSIKKTISFKEMEAKQQKLLLAAAMENTLYNYLFSKNFYEIINQNLIESDDFKKEDLNKLNIFDKASIAIHLRNQISNKLKVVFNSEEKLSENIELESVIEKIKNIEYTDNIYVDVVNKDTSIKVLLKLPSIKNEMIYDEEVSKLFKKSNDIKTDDDVKTLVTEAFISEASKYISKIYISSQEIDFELLTLKQKIQITERLSSTIMQKILETVSEWKSILDSALEVKYKEYTSTIKIDSILFLN
jgi:hypothetical protein